MRAPAGDRRLRPAACSLLGRCLWLAVVVVGIAAPAVSEEFSSRILPAEGLDAESAALLLSQEDGGDLPLRASLFVTDGEASDRRGTLTVLLEMNRSDVGLGPPRTAAEVAEVPGERQVVQSAEDRSPTARLDVFLYQLDAELGVVDAHIRVVQIESRGEDRGEGLLPAADQANRAIAGRLRYLTEVSLDDDAVEARILVRARTTGRAALRRQPVTEPGPWPVLPIVSARPLPVIVDGDFPDRVVDWARSSVLLVGLEPDPAGAHGDGASTVRSEPGDETAGTGAVPLAAAVPVETLEPVELLVEIRSGEQVLWSETVQAEPRPSELKNGWALVPLLPPFADFGPGRYQVAVRSALDSTATPAATLVHEVLVRSSVDTATTPFAGEGRRLAIPAQELRSETLAALGDLVDGETAAALSRLSAVERRAIAGSGERLAVARGAQVRALTRLAAESDELLPAIDLFLRAYRDRRASGDFLLTTHAREMTLTLLDHYLRSEDSDPAEAAAFLVALAKARSPGPSDAAVPLLEWAIELDGSSVDALWLRAAVAEGQGDLEEAARWWRLAGEHSEDPEVKLHLGIALLRSETRRARREGRSILAALSGQSGWVGEGARSELAREALQRGERSEAVAWVDSAGPQSDPSLQVLRSYLAFVAREEHELSSYGDAGHRGQEAVPARRRYATAWQRRAVEWSAPPSAIAGIRFRLSGG